MLELFLRGGPIMWPILLVSIITVGVVIERCVFIVTLYRSRERRKVGNFLDLLEQGKRSEAQSIADSSTDFVLHVLGHGLRHSHEDFHAAVQHSAYEELGKFERGLSTLDTVITLAPLLGLLGTVTGMIHAFGLLGGNELGAPAAITGGIAEALLATAFGLGIAITALLPFNFLNRLSEKAKFEVQNSATRLELILKMGEHTHSLPEARVH